MNTKGLKKLTLIISLKEIYNFDSEPKVKATVTVTDKHAEVRLMKNINKPLPDGGVALPTSETGQSSWDLRKRRKKNEI